MPAVLRERVERMEKQRLERKEKAEARVKRKRLEQENIENQSQLHRLEEDLTIATLERMAAFYDHLASHHEVKDTIAPTQTEKKKRGSPEMTNQIHMPSSGQGIGGAGRVVWLEGDEEDPFRIHPRVALQTT